ncbi:MULTISPECIES: flagellar hook assembly protein FlgD [Pseudomonas]|jgi:flagellar basal-body rod modification protein FlgD|uniref:Basal-body rod modification protein FlgD n=1 Tax=Pseudomonas frederiksbergensis TaxID=104087 RepID=A0A0B1Z547_9PSED|nr:MULTISPECIES: flagellar hook assembly protein FlgD [Pseudomonas]KHK64326.1 flagellar basal body rod modification protein FlgD [Pseudomonas frederiksbergensis]KJH84345.1 flagellar basal body rod modification protein FlgD [Pseudomonas fluorescens]MBI6618215.1 flagellar hook assembly protein FlgD [Pseudomonas corrugata]MBI6693556.1 flagellar hook assembly protein FlgD [Pseudomonas corrugata]WRV69755.1 flagellar hook assembly protein FlgD [Pseudomonas frederiksbergensis]
MSVTNTTGGLSLNEILANSSVKTNTKADGLGAATNAASGNQELGKDAFLQLLVTQLKNQNPLEPQDNGEFVAQLAQFSSLEGITTLNDTVSGIAGNYNSSQALQASSLVGRSVIAPGDKAVVDTSKSLNGTVVVPAAVSSLTVKIMDKDGKTVRTIDLGSQKSGNSAFIWDGKNDAGTTVESGTYTFAASTTIDGQATSLITNLPATVSSVTISQTGGELMLNLAGLGSIALSKVQTIGM